MKVGIIGIGAISRTHISALVNNKQDIVALCDVKEEKCIKANEEFSLSAKVYTDYKKMLDENDLDVIHICTPHYLHAEMVCEGLRRNINVLSEKPLGISLEQLDEIGKAVKSSKAQLAVCFQNRFNETSVYLKEFLKDKKVVSAYAAVIWQRNAAYYAQDKWRGTWAEEGGGVMINQAIHTVDLMQWLCGMPETV
ncbi:MAG: Gfo/Idh/MocA family oxidoreductase, partial [Ruminococcaceae bacterium]|nr:Gfo/Idh/MocA family oxidoreductase [Oscillospiraceae bacterium]